MDNDKGPNTGGMGSISPSPQISKSLFNTIMKTIIQPTIGGLRFENKSFKGILYAGLMITADGPKVLEFNARFGDPETQVVLLRLKSDLVDLLEAAADESLLEVAPEWDEKVSGCVVLASKGYPGKYEVGKPIEGLERAKALRVEIFHAGTAHNGRQLVTQGGRVLNICTSGSTMKETIEKLYEAISFINFDHMTFRRDIGLSRK